MLPSLFLALALALAAPPPDPDPPEREVAVADALAEVHARLATVPMVMKLRAVLDAEPPERLAMELHRIYEELIVDPLRPPARDPQTLYQCFALVAGLGSLHFRAPEPVAELEARAAFHAHQIGQAWRDDPTFAAELTAWARRQPDDDRRDIARLLAASLDALPAVTAAWLPAARAQLQQTSTTPSDVHETHYGLWLLDLGRNTEAADHLVPLISRSGLRGTVAAAYRALRATGRDADARTLRSNANAASVTMLLDEVDQAREDAEAATRFAAMPAPRPIEAWLAWGERIMRSDSTEHHLDRVEEMVREHPTDARVARLAAALRASLGDVHGLHQALADAEARGVPADALIDVRLVASTLLESLRDEDRPDVINAVPFKTAVRDYRRHFKKGADPEVRAAELLLYVPAQARGDVPKARVRRAALALARKHRADADAATFAAGALLSMDLHDDAEQALLGAARANPEAAGELLLAAGRVRLHAGLLTTDPTAADTATQHHAVAAAAEAPAHLVRLQNIQAELLRRSLENDDDAIRTKAARWADTLGEVELRLSNESLDDVLRHTIAINLASLSALLDNRRGMFAPLQVARDVDPTDPSTKLLLGQYALSGGDGARAKDALTGVVLSGTSVTKRWVAHKWLMFLAEQLGDAQGVYLHREALLDLFDEAGVPERAPGLHALLISSGRVEMRLSFTPEAPTHIQALVAPTLVMLADIPHDLAELRDAHR